MNLSETQFPASRMLLCTGDYGHTCAVPKIGGDGATGDVRCAECGEPMLLVDVIVVDRNPTWATLSYDRGGRMYTTAKLHPVSMIAARSRAAE